ncbi:hypothetical protein, partial [Nocardia sp. NRRL S-836]|uniref:hypothetical protein n=1 Tax=Nocardia sp. NRRL S-836 TaxID=1519492 RepID=UPI0006BECF75
PDSPHGRDADTPHPGPAADKPHDTPDKSHDSDPTTHDPDAPPADRPSPDEAHQRHAETTEAGVSHHGGDPNMGDLPHRVPNDPRYFTADVHVTPDGRARVGGHDYTPAEYADMLRRSGYDGSKPVRLIGCDAGSNDFAKQLSKHLDAPVLAPTKPAWTDTHGRVFTSDAELHPDGTRQPKIPPNGEWETHHPDGTKTKTGDDGYAPDSDRHDGTDTDGAVDRGDPPYERDPEFAHHPDDLPPTRAEAQVLEQLDLDRCQPLDENGLITHYNGEPIEQYLNRVLEDRAKLIENKIADGTIKPPNHPAQNIQKYANNNVVCTSVAVDRQTGKIYESVNGSNTDLIPEDKLHPALAARREAMMNNPPPDGDGLGYTQPDRSPDRLGQPLLDRNGEEFRTPFPINDAPTRHAEVKNVNQMLLDRGVPPDVSPEELRKILGEMRVDNAFTPAKVGAVRDGRFPDTAQCCANCTRMIDGVPSSAGKLTHPPGDPRLQVLPE